MTVTYEILHACPACGCSDLEVVADEADVQRQAEALWLFHTRRVHGGTPPERLLDRSAFSQRQPLAIAACSGCGTLARNPREDPETLRDVYADEAIDEATLAGLLEMQRATYTAQAERLSATLGRTGTVLEVGSYVGGFLEAAAGAGWRAEGVDVNPRAVAFARARGMRVYPGGIADLDPSRRYDAVVFWNVFEQLDDPAASLAGAHSRLASGGIIVVRVPNGAFYRALVHVTPPLRAIAWALLAWNNLLAFPYRHGFTPTGLDALFARERMRVVRLHGDALVRISDEHTRGWARAEERVLKRGLRLALHRHSPWLEAYAR